MPASLSPVRNASVANSRYAGATPAQTRCTSASGVREREITQQDNRSPCVRGCCHVWQPRKEVFRPPTAPSHGPAARPTVRVRPSACRPPACPQARWGGNGGRCGAHGCHVCAKMRPSGEEQPETSNHAKMNLLLEVLEIRMKAAVRGMSSRNGRVAEKGSAPANR